mmetsp:Transcript_18320/g.64353  ORF Transcript_18320/g.64353 Transcript_18320/m.64353 type:complete len:210 (-) Transcript_18320:3-632(-)
MAPYQRSAWGSFPWIAASVVKASSSAFRKFGTRMARTNASESQRGSCAMASRAASRNGELTVFNCVSNTMNIDRNNCIGAVGLAVRCCSINLSKVANARQACARAPSSTCAKKDATKWHAKTTSANSAPSSATEASLINLKYAEAENALAVPILRSSEITAERASGFAVEDLTKPTVATALQEEVSPNDADMLKGVGHNESANYRNKLT